MSEYADLLACYRSGQIPEAAWQEHLKDEGLRAYVEGLGAVGHLDPKALRAAAIAAAPGSSVVECIDFAEPIVRAYLSAAVPADLAGLVEELQTFKAAFAAEGDNFGMEVSEAFHNAATALVSMSAELAAARKALEPFASMGELLKVETEGFSDTDEFDLMFGDHLFHRFTVTHFDVARRAHKGGEIDE